MTDQATFKNYIENNIKLLSYMQSGLKEECPVPPLHMYIEPTNVCNLNCPFCDGAGSNRPLKFMDFDVFASFIAEVKRLGWYPRVTLTGTGEPMLHKNLVAMVRLAKDANLNTSILSNATMGDAAVSEQLVKAKLDRIQFSIDSIDKDTYDRIRISRKKGHSYFSAAIRNALTYIKLNYEYNRPTYVSISTVQYDLTRDKAKEFVDFWNRFPVDNVYLQPLLTLQTHSALPEAADSQYHGEMKDKQICTDPWISLYIYANGNVHACSFDHYDHYPLGNISDTSIKEIWNNDKIKKLRRALISGKVDYFCSIDHDCQKCNNPLSGGGLDDYIKNAPGSIAKTASTFLEHREKDDVRYKNVIEELKKWQNEV